MPLHRGARSLGLWTPVRGPPQRQGLWHVDPFTGPRPSLCARHTRGAHPLGSTQPNGCRLKVPRARAQLCRSLVSALLCWFCARLQRVTSVFGPVRWWPAYAGARGAPGPGVTMCATLWHVCRVCLPPLQAFVKRRGWCSAHSHVDAARSARRARCGVHGSVL